MRWQTAVAVISVSVAGVLSGHPVAGASVATAIGVISRIIGGIHEYE